MSITELSIKRPLLITVIFTVLILFGILGYTNLNYELLPKFDAGVISINTTYVGASPQDIESAVTKPIEDAVSTVEGLDIVTSRSMENVSTITIQLKPEVDDVVVQQDIERKINQIKSTLPEDIEDPVINRFSSDQFPVLNLSVSANLSDTRLYQLVEDNILPGLTNVTGVGQVSIIGGSPREIKVEINNHKLNFYNIPISQVYQALHAASLVYPAGKLSSQQQELSLRLNADLTTTDMIRNIIIRENKNGSKVLIKDIAKVVDTDATPKTINRINGVNGIGLQIFKTNDANTVEVSKKIKEKLNQLVNEYSKEEFAYTIASDQSLYTLASADAVVHDLILAIFIVGLVMLFFLHSLRSSMFVLVAIPSAMIPTFMMMSIFGFSLNLMTLMALSLVVGILVDDSIVVLENIFRHLEMGKNKVRAAIDGRQEIGFTAVAITMVDLVVFIPMALTSGLVGNLVRQFSLVVVFSTLLSLFVSFTLTPLLASLFGKVDHLNKSTWWGRINIQFENFLGAIKMIYGHILLWVLRHKRILFACIFTLMAGSIWLIPGGFIGSSFLDSGDRGEISIKVEMSTDMSLYQTNQMLKQAESIILKNKDVETLYTLVGTQTGGGGTTSTNAHWGQMDIVLKDKTKREITTDEFGVLVRNEIESSIPGVKVTALPMNITGSSNSPIQIAIKGASLENVKEAAEIVKKIVESTPGTDYVKYSTQSERKQIQIIPDRVKISSMKLTIQEVSQMINIAFKGNDNIDLKENDNEYAINIQMDDTNKLTVENLRDMILTNKEGRTIRLSQIASIEETMVSSILERTNRLPSITINSAAVGRASGTIVKEIKEKLIQVSLPTGVSIEYMGDQKRQEEAFSSLIFALGIGILLIYLIMVALYESLLYPFVVLFSIPVAIIGALLALALTMNNLTTFSLCGLIMLLGLVAKNGILIVDFANHLKSKGLPLTQVLVEAGKERLRPIIMTTFAMILGMLPLALSQSPGSELKNGMAWIIIGGLTSSFFLTLLIVPCVYMVVDNLKTKFSHNKQHE